MRPKSIAMLLLALGCGLVAAIGYIEVRGKQIDAPSGMSGETRSIFVAITDIGLGDLLTSQVLKLEQWPKDKVPPGAIARIEEIEGRRARAKLYAGEPILENRLLGKGASEQGATALIPKGYRVVPVKVDLVSGGSSMILPGDRVDVMVHLVREPSREIQETVTRTILQDVKVFAVNDVVDLEREKDGGKTITAKTISLLVTPEQAARVMLATQLGTINLVMRSPEDDQQIPDAQAKPSELFSTSSKKSNHGNESLVAPSDTSLNEKTQGFLEFLNSMKTKTAGTAAPAADEKNPRETWSMRVLKASDVGEVQFQADEMPAAGASPLGSWKAMTMAGSQNNAPPAKAQPQPPPAAQEPADSPAGEGPQPKLPPQKEKGTAQPPKNVQ